MQLTLRGDYFNGKFTAPNGLTGSEKSDEEIRRICPGDLDLTLWRAQINYENIEKVLESSNNGFKAWRLTGLNERLDCLKRFKEEAIKRKDEMALAIAWETGKPLWEAKTEAGAIAGKVDVTISDSLERVKNRTISQVLPDIDGHFVFKPLGPCLVIGPFNFPCHLANTQLLAAIVTGNSVIFKPSEKTIASSQILMECFDAAGFPPGVVNFINGTVHTTQTMLKDPRIKGIFFTGSHFVGTKILEAVGTDVTKLVALEMGGKNTSIIHKDADIEHALPELLRACFLSCGQRCTSTSVIPVHRSREQEFVDHFKAISERVIVDHPVNYSIEPFMGPIIDEQALTKYESSLKLGLDNGATEILAHRRLDMNGHYLAPSIFHISESKKSNPYTQEEIFGPHCTFVPYDEIEEAIEIANISDYGLAASVFTQDKNIYQTCLRDIDAGIINLNRSTVGASARLPFGGVKNSGNHHPAAVSMIDATVHLISSLETMDNSSTLDSVKGLKN
ncbi:MAG: hypothetical protein CME65_01720 [Halobacteriovoraceae bacterium]|nr:hypothetical protein [Halobacteriovoraceae bacterium]